MNQQIELLTFLNKHKNDLVFEPQMYSNQLTIAFARNLIPNNMNDIFPEMRLHVERLSDESLIEAKPLLEFIIAKLNDKETNYKNVWMTTSNITERHLAMVEISFE